MRQSGLQYGEEHENLSKFWMQTFPAELRLELYALLGRLRQL